MNPLDWLLAALLTYSIVKAFIQGFFREALALAGLVFGLLFAGWFSAAFALRLHGLIASPQIAQLTAFLLILAATMFAASLLARVLRKSASAIGLGLVDRFAGAAFGFARGCLFGVAILFALTAFLPTSDWVRTSILAPYFLRGAHAVSFVVPHDLQRKVSDGIAHTKHTAPDWIK